MNWVHSIYELGRLHLLHMITASEMTFTPGQEYHGGAIGQLAAVASCGAATRLEGLE